MVGSKQLDQIPYKEVEIDRIDDNPHQPRKLIDENELNELAASIETNGLLQAIIVKRHEKNNQRYILCGGQRRLLAFKKLGRDHIPIIIVDRGEPDEIALIENIQRAELHPLDHAEALSGLKKRYDYTDDHIAENLLHKARSTVTELLRLSDLPDDIKQECREVNIKKSKLLRLARVIDPAQQRAAWEAMKDKSGRSRRPTMPREVRPLVQFLDVGNKVVESLQNTDATTFIDHVDQLEAIQKLHQALGRLIKTTLQKVEKQASLKQRAEQQSTSEPQGDGAQQVSHEDASAAHSEASA